MSCIREKFKGNSELIDIEARINLYINKIVAVMKYHYRVNYYSERDKEINQGKITN